MSSPDEPTPSEVIKQLTLTRSVQEQTVMQQRDAHQEATQLILQFKRQLIEAAIAVDRKAESQQSRMEFLTRAIGNAQKENERLAAKLRQIGRDSELQNDRFEHQLESLAYQARETEHSIRSKLSITLSELQTLRQFQEHKHKMDERMRELGNIISRERKERTAELAHVHRQLVAQREFYERQLTSQLTAADEYATRFNDLDLDGAMTKVLQQTERRREELKGEHALTSEVIKRNDQLRHQVQDLEHQSLVLEESERNLTTQAVDLKAKLQETTGKRDEAATAARERIAQLKRHLAGRMEDLGAQLAEAKRRLEALRRELALAEKQLATAEAQRDERQRKTTNLLSVMNETAIFILTSLNYQESDPSKDEIAAHSGALNAIIRKMANVGQDFTGIQQAQVTDTIVSKSVQTTLPVKKFVSSGNAAKPPKVSEFRRASEYQRVFAKEAGPPRPLRLARAPK